MSNVYVEPSRELTVEAECDILVVGGGDAGHSAAVAAARAGAKRRRHRWLCHHGTQPVLV